MNNIEHAFAGTLIFVMVAKFLIDGFVPAKSMDKWDTLFSKILCTVILIYFTIIFSMCAPRKPAYLRYRATDQCRCTVIVDTNNASWEWYYPADSTNNWEACKKFLKRYKHEHTDTLEIRH